MIRYMQFTCNEAQKKIEREGITNCNEAVKISINGGRVYRDKRFDEVEADMIAKKGAKKRFIGNIQKNCMTYFNHIMILKQMMCAMTFQKKLKKR